MQDIKGSGKTCILIRVDTNWRQINTEIYYKFEIYILSTNDPLEELIYLDTLCES